MGQRDGWIVIGSDQEFRELFAGQTITKVTAGPGPDIVWHFADGGRLGMDYPPGDGCPTCGYGNEPTYYRWVPPAAHPEEGA
jgi:hypothetical protein